MSTWIRAMCVVRTISIRTGWSVVMTTVLLSLPRAMMGPCPAYVWRAARSRLRDGCAPLALAAHRMRVRGQTATDEPPSSATTLASYLQWQLAQEGAMATTMQAAVFLGKGKIS